MLSDTRAPLPEVDILAYSPETVVRERRIPFEIKASSKEQINKEAWAAFLEMKGQATATGAQDMNLKEINAEIQQARNER